MMNRHKIRDKSKKIYTDLSTISLVLSNLLVSYFAIKNHWAVLTLMWIFFLQGIIIIAFKIATIKNNYNLSKTNIKPEQYKEISSKYGRHVIIYFSIFMLILVFASLETSGLTHKNLNNVRNFGGSPDVTSIILSTFLFLANHAFSFLYNRSRNFIVYKTHEDIYKDYEKFVMKTMIMRILPIQLSPLAAVFAGSQAIMIAFLALKIMFDVAGHILALNGRIRFLNKTPSVKT